ncbi:MAG: AmpG family muropeptide MFS transporter [Pseudomonadota bacterium]
MDKAEAPPPAPGLVAAIRAYWKPRIALMLMLGFSAGLPFLLVFQTLSAWLTQAGVSRTEIGFFSWVGLAYAFKFLWAPVLDHVRIPWLSERLGRRRSWMLLAQAFVALGIILVATSNPAENLWGVAAFAVLIAFSSATQDIAIDAWRIEAAPDSEQGNMAAVYQLGYRLAIMASGGGALIIADAVNWNTAYLAMAALMGVGAAAALLAPEPERAETDEPPTFSLAFARDAVISPFLDFLNRYGATALLILALIGTYRIPDFVMGVMARPFYLDVGFTLSEVGTISGVYGIWITIFGAFVGGLAVTGLGLRNALLIGAVIGSATNLIYIWLDALGPEQWGLIVAISAENLAGGFAGTALIAYMSSLTNTAFTATQYALFSSFYALPAKFMGGFSGLVVDAAGYPTFFLITALTGVPAILLILASTRERLAVNETRAT